MIATCSSNEIDIKLLIVRVAQSMVLTNYRCIGILKTPRTCLSTRSIV